MRPDINGFVLAGGKSTRMGRDKALLELGGKCLALRAAGVLAPFVAKVALLGPADRYGNLGLPVIADRWPGQGPLAAVYTGLLTSTAAWNIFLPCDLPFLSQRFIQLLLHRVGATSAEAVVPRTADGWQPLTAAYHLRCGNAFGRAVHAGERSMIRALEEIRVEAITPDAMAAAGLGEMELANMNTPEDWARFGDRAKKGELS